MIPPDLIAQVDQHAAQVCDLLDRLVENQRPFVAEQGSDNSIYCFALAAILIEKMCPGEIADMAALAARRLAAQEPTT